MHSKKPDLQQWSIRAEFTISPNENYAPERKSLNNNVQDKSGVQLSYCWRSNENTNTVPTLPARSNFCKPTEYQRGSITFTSTPPCRIPSSDGASRNNFEVHDSGYGSDLLSPNSFARRTAQGRNISNNRKCKSTCNIVLCTNACYNVQNSTMPDQVILETTNQVPSLYNTKPNTNISNTNDPWCSHSNVLKNKDLSGRKSYYDAETSKYPIKTRPSSLYGNIDQMNYKLPKRDVSIQTSDSLQKCSATALRHGTKPKSKKHDKTISKNCKRNSYKPNDNTSSITENAEKFKPSSSTKHNINKNIEANDHTSDSSKKSRTIHIDVYCTDTEIEDSDVSEASTDSWENKSTLSSQTVFKSGDFHVKHERAKNDGFLPFKLKNSPYKNALNSTTSVDISDSDMDCELSTNYPSKIGSSSTINDFSSSISSFMSWKNNSLLSCANDYGSFNNFNNMSTSSINNRSALHKTNSAERSLYNQYFKKCFNDRTNYLSSEQGGTNIFSQNDSHNPRKHFLNQQNDLKIKDNIEEDKIKAKIPIKSDIYAPSKSDFSVVEPAKEVSSQGNFTTDNPTARLVLDPFSGQYTEQIASRFGQVINVIKKSGHHIGPTKNPLCSCDHCRRHFE